MKSELCITGTGLITPLGIGVDATWRALMAGEFIRDHAKVRLDASQESRVHQLAVVAAREAIDRAGWGGGVLADPQTGLVIGTSKGPVESWLTPALEISPQRRGVVDPSFSYGLSNLATSLATEMGIHAGPRATLSAACASGIHALLHATMLIRSNQARRVLVVAAEASVHPLFIGSFKRLGVLPREGVGCRPFDRDRDGFLVSEAAAAVCVERLDDSRRPIVAIDRIAIGGDATHLTGSDPHGRTLGYLLRKVIDDRSVDLFHAHATGTPLNDPIELAAMEACVAPAQGGKPHIYSHKGAVGHSLGAAGMVSVVLNCASHQTGVIPPNVQTRHPLPTTNTVLSLPAMTKPIRRSVTTAAGFGGAVAVAGLASIS